MAQKTQTELLAEIAALIDITGKKLTTGQRLITIFTDLFDSYPNIVTQAAYLGLKEYVTTKPYVVGEGVLRNNELLQCTTNTSGAFVAGSWKKILTLATETVAGILEIATTAETIARAVNDRIVTPFKLGQYVDVFVQQVKVGIDTAQVQTLFSAPVKIVSKTDGEYTELIKICGFMRPGGSPYSIGNLRIRFKGTASILAAFSNNFYTASGADYVESIEPQSINKLIITEDLELYNDTGDDGTGDGSLILWVFFRKLTFG